MLFTPTHLGWGQSESFLHSSIMHILTLETTSPWYMLTTLQYGISDAQSEFVSHFLWHSKSPS
jgi:hypothetical protein